MRKLLLLLVLFSKSILCYSQKENNIWYFGHKSGMDFNSGSPVSLNNGKMTTIEGCATISNASGQLLFYTNGMKVWNRNHEVMPNGNGLKGDNSSTQAAIFIPKPGSSTIYYLFTSSGGGYINGLNYSEIDLTLNGGLGDVTSIKNIPLYAPVCEKLCAIKNTATNSYWLVSHAFGSNSFLTFNINASGVNASPVVSNVGSTVALDANATRIRTIGYMKLSPDGSKLVCANTFQDTQLFDFNILTGSLTNPVTLNAVPNWSCYGAEFSPSSKILYLTADSNLGMFPDYLLQYDLSAPNIQASETIIHYASMLNLAGLQLAPDCKIYGNFEDKRILYEITNPDVLGLGCGFQPSSLQLRGVTNYGLPQSIQNSNCKNRTIINDDICLGENMVFTLTGSENVTTASWNFGDGNTSNNLIGQNNYTAPGTYLVTGNFATATVNFTVTKQITVPENPIVHPIGEIAICGPGSNPTYNLNQLNAAVLGNQSTNVYGIAYFSSMQDAVDDLNRLPSIQTLTNTVTTIFVKVYKLSNFNCYGIGSFTIRLSDYPILNAISEYRACDDGTPNDGIATFDLDTKTAEFLNGQSPSDYKAAYFLNAEDAQNNSNPITAPLNNSTNPQMIFARISTLPTEACFHITSFPLIAIPAPELNIQPEYALCEGNNNAISINLPNTFNSYLWSTGNTTPAISISAPGNYWITVTQDNNGIICSETKNFEVILSNKAVIKKIVAQDWTDNENSIVIDANGLGNYEYSLDGSHYQDSNFFDGLFPGEYMVYVRDKNGCGITTDSIFLLMYPKFFTPNGDGYNDSWKLKFSESEPGLTIGIFDRYGKLIARLSKKNNSWDGKLNGKNLPSDDYWFIVTRENGKQHKGHFTLKR